MKGRKHIPAYWTGRLMTGGEPFVLKKDHKGYQNATFKIRNIMKIC